uniref:Clp R domain-containing protein n=1 Tax=Ananas comosus var. bracteatus TaxID=296719 RepID=A0A6V7QMX9_ANACO|nr:unnamed protein product [Ananas comosus var. bracteatus]
MATARSLFSAAAAAAASSTTTGVVVAPFPSSLSLPSTPKPFPLRSSLLHGNHLPLTLSLSPSSPLRLFSPPDPFDHPPPCSPCSPPRNLIVVTCRSKPEIKESEEKPKWSARAIKSFCMAELEARKLKYPNTGTEALLMGILVEGTSEAAKFLRANGITLFKVREETIKLLGKSDMYFFSPEHPPLTEPAQRALDWAVDEKLKSVNSGKDGEITTTHLLLGIWSEKESAGHKILASLGFDDQKAAELAKNADKDVVMSYR